MLWERGCVTPAPGEQGYADNVAVSLLARATVASDERVVNAEHGVAADITHNPIRDESLQEDALLDALLLADGNVVLSDLHTVRGVVESIRAQLRNKDNVVVPRGSDVVNEFTANDVLLHRSFPCLFMFGVGINGVAGVSESDTRHLLLQVVPSATGFALLSE